MTVWHSCLQVRALLQSHGTGIPVNVREEPQCCVPQARLQRGQQSQLGLLCSLLCIHDSVLRGIWHAEKLLRMLLAASCR